MAVTSMGLPAYLGGAFLSAVLVALAGTYLVREWASSRGYLDRPDESRRVHDEPTPNVGGIAVALGATVVFFAWSYILLPQDFLRPDIVAMLGGGLLMFGVGLWDDFRTLKPRTKFLLQALIASGVFWAGVRIAGGSFLVWTGTLPLLASYVITTVWIVGTTNAFNLIDGSDGVASGAALLASASLVLVFALLDDPLGALMAVVLVGVCLGFLFFNFPPASIFLGDGGSLFLGYTLATLGVITTNKASTLLAIAIPVVAFGVPLLDTGIAIVRRFLSREPILGADRGHIHHRLRDLGHSPRRVAITIYVMCAGFAGLSMLIATGGPAQVLPIFVVFGTSLVLGVQRLHLPELSELRHVIERGFQQRWVIAHNLRIRTAGRDLAAARDARAILDALARSFKESEFSRVEVWVPSGLAGTLTPAANGRLLRDGEGYRLTVRLEEVASGPEIEVRIPLLVDGAAVGAISLFKGSDGERLFTDLRLLSSQLAPALLEALGRVGGGAPPRRPATPVRTTPSDPEPCPSSTSSPPTPQPVTNPGPSQS